MLLPVLVRRVAEEASMKHGLLAVALLVAVSDSAFAEEPLSLSRAATDSYFEPACGPINAYLALRWLGFSAGLDEVAKSCQWKPGQRVTLRQIVGGLSDYPQVTCRAARLTKASLASLLRREHCCVILATRSGDSQEINHVVCALSTNEDGVLTVSYPELVKTMDWRTLLDRWDGDSIVVSRSFYGSLQFNAPYLVLPSILMAAWMGTTLYRRLRPRWPSNGRSMRLILLCVSLVVLTCSRLTAAEQDVGVDRVVEREHDFGIVEPGQELEHRFPIRNELAQAVVVSAGEVSCGCLKVIDLSKQIDANGGGHVTVALSTQGKIGLVRQKAIVTVGKIRQAYFVTAMVKGIHCQPQSIDLGRSRGGESAGSIRLVAPGVASARMVRIQYDPKSWEVLCDGKAISSDENLDIPFMKSATHIPDLTLVVRSHKAAVLGRRSADLQFHVSSGEETSVVKVPISASIVGDAVATPVTLNFGVVRGTEVHERKCLITWPKGKKPAIDNLQCTASDPEVIKVMVKPHLKLADAYELVATLDPTKVTAKSVTGSISVSAALGTQDVAISYVAVIGGPSQ
ncbi:MAG: hypothetical protein JWP89_1328 [Schlesneria sp.]|nr:hypothetical protein [Schlesneria sp.]